MFINDAVFLKRKATITLIYMLCLWLILALSSTSTAYDVITSDCHFAQNYNHNELFVSTTLQEKFLLKVSWWQGVFARNDFRNEALTIFCIMFNETVALHYEKSSQPVRLNGTHRSKLPYTQAS